MHLSYWKTAEVARVHGSLVSFAGLLSAFLYTAVQIHAKLIMELNRVRLKFSIPVQVGRGSNAQSSCGIALVPACGGRRELLCIIVCCELTCKSTQDVCICHSAILVSLAAQHSGDLFNGFFAVVTNNVTY